MSPSPRPTFAEPTVIPFSRTVHHVWGDESAGRVDDWIYVSSDKIHMLVFGMSPEMWFRHSPENRTVFGADELYYVLQGVLVIANPETGEVHRVRQGEAVFFRKDTWHHGTAEGPEPLRVLELFSPPPSQGTSQAYARTRPYLRQVRYTQDALVGQWPLAQASARAAHTMQVLRDGDLLWRYEGMRQEAQVGLLVSTEHLTGGYLRLGPGLASGPRLHRGACILYLMEGSVDLVTRCGRDRLHARDGAYIPEGERYELISPPGERALLLFGTAPGYLPGGMAAEVLPPEIP